MKEKIILVAAHGFDIARLSIELSNAIKEDVEIVDWNNIPKKEVSFEIKAAPQLAEITETYYAPKHQKNYLPLPKKSWKKKLKR